MPRVLILLAIMLELLAWLTLWAPIAEHWQWLLYFLTHGLAVPGLARALWHQLPRKYRVPGRSSLTFLYSFIFCVPFVGAAGVLWGLAMALKLPRRKRFISVKSISLPVLPFQAPQIHTVLPYSAGALRQILRFAEAPLKRVKAVMATRQMPLSNAVPILQVALRDRMDDVRLLAYSMRDAQEKILSDTIQSLQRELPELTGSRAVRAHELIAQQCWELLYSGLVQGAVRQHWLHQALQHSALAGEHLAMQELRMRLHLENNDLGQARVALEYALSAGMSEARSRIWLAEMAFRERDFSGVQTIMQTIPVTGQRGSVLADVISWWHQGVSQ